MKFLRTTIVVSPLVLIILTVWMSWAFAQQTPVYDANGHYSGSVFNYGKTQTYTDRNGHFSGSAVNNGNGTTTFYGPRGNFTGSAGSSINRAFNFKK
jgi:hypothetical protein